MLSAISSGELPPPPAAVLLGIAIERVEPGTVRFRFDADERYGNPTRVHGGIVSAVVDFAGSTAVWSTLPAEADVVTADLHVSFHRGLPLDGRRYSAVGEVVHLGRTQAAASVHVVAVDTGALHVSGALTCRIRWP